MAQYRVVSRGACHLLLALWAALVALTPAQAEPDAAAGNGASWTQRLRDRVDRLLLPRCLTPDAGRALQALVAAGALQPVLANEFTLLRGDVGGDRIELEIEDAAHQPYGITLALPGTRSGTPDGHGQRFLFYLKAPASPPSPRARAALLAVAALFDGAVPDSALAPCGGGDETPTERRYPRALVLAGAALQVLAIAAAILFGLRAIS